MATQNTLIVSEVGKPLTKATRPIPNPQENQLLVKITSAGINPHDQKVRDWGLFIGTNVPAILVNDIAGIITDVGPNVNNFAIGDHVFGQSRFSLDTGGLQEYALLDSDVTAHVPSCITDDEAATLPVNCVAPFVAMFHDSGLGIPSPFAESEEATKFDYASHSLVIIGGGTNCGKFGVQLAAIAHIGKIIAIAGLENTEELKGYGATHVIDRHASLEEITIQVREIVGDELIYVVDTINTEFTLAASMLSSTKYGRIATLLRGGVDVTTIGEKKAGYRIQQTIGSSHMHGDFTRRFWKELPGWVEDGSIKPLGFKVVEGGLSLDGVNKVLDEYRDGRNPGKWHVHPNL